MKTRRVVLLFLLLFLAFPLHAQDIDSTSSLRLLQALIRDGSLEELQAACRARGLSSEGDVTTLKRRILQYERELGSVPFSERIALAVGEDIVLHHADFVRSVQAENGDELIFLAGNVVLEQAGRNITGDELKINSTQGLISGSGNIRFVDGNSVYVGEGFFYSTETDDGYFYTAKTSIDEFIYTGRSIRKISAQDKFTAKDVSLSTDNIRYTHYRVAAEELFFYDSEKVLVKNASLYYGQDDLVRLPYMYRNFRERTLRTSLYFRERSGLVLQNTYRPISKNERQFVLKGDFYERLGFYSGVDFSTLYKKGETDVDLSAALSNDVYFYDEVVEKWSPLGPPGSGAPSIDRSLRYRTGFYQKFVFGKFATNTTELRVLHIADPYYEYDFERRSVGFDLFDFVNQAENDSPRKGAGYSWYLNNNFQYGSFTWYLKNRVNFEPQRNTDVTIVSLPDYYEYRLYTITAPQTGVAHTTTLFENGSPLIADMDLSSYADYTHILYYDEDESLASELHKANGEVSVKKEYQLGSLFQLTPQVAGGARGQLHTDPSSGELAEDRRNTFVYGQIIDAYRFGLPNVYIDVTHDLKYKFIGPDDRFPFNRFRVHDVTLRGHAELWKLTEDIETLYDLRPTYNWTTGEYESFQFDGSHFDPLKNTLTFTPVEQITLSDVLVYDIVSSRFKTNDLGIIYKSSDMGLRSHTFNISYDLEWRHNFINPIIDELRSIFRIDASFYRFWTAYFSVYSRNEEIWRYLPNTARKQGVEPVNPVTDLLKSYNFFNRDDRKASHFKLKSLSFGLVRDLHDWELKFDYTGNRELAFDGSKFEWDSTFAISISLKELEGVDIHTSFNEKR
jgi:lipopolysaccharide assembly outer membrane protein LptD (OstA)